MCLQLISSFYKEPNTSTIPHYNLSMPWFHHLLKQILAAREDEHTQTMRLLEMLGCKEHQGC